MAHRDPWDHIFAPHVPRQEPVFAPVFVQNTPPMHRNYNQPAPSTWRDNTALPPPKLEGKELTKARIHLSPTQNYAEVVETLHFSPLTNPDQAANEEPAVVGAGKESKFIHGMDKRSMVTRFNAKVYKQDDPTKLLFEINANVKEKEKARKEFDNAIRAGKQAIFAQSDKHGDNFSISVGAIGNDELVIVEFSYLVIMDLHTAIKHENGEQNFVITEDTSYDLLLPVDFKPKYDLGAGNADDPVFISGANAGKVKESIRDPVVTIKSTTPMVVTKLNSAVQTNLNVLAESRTVPEMACGDGTFEYTYTMEDRDKTDVHLRFTYAEKMINTTEELEQSQFRCDHVETRLFKFDQFLPSVEDAAVANPLSDKYGLIVDYSIRRHMMYKVPPTQWSKRIYHFVIDCSGSMGGKPMMHTRVAMDNALRKLPKNGLCKLNMTKFGNHFDSWKPKAVMVTDESIREALNWASNLDATMGGTEMLSVMKRVCEEQDAEADYKKQVILLTDACVGGYDRITRTVSHNYENADKEKPVIG